jgi:hypothetical protein
MEWYGLIQQGSADSEGVLLLYDFLTDTRQEQPLFDAIMQLAPIKEWKRVVFINAREMRLITQQPYAASIRDLRRKSGDDQFDEVYLARNYIGRGSALILRAYPKATRIQYGDGFGFVSSEEKERNVSSGKAHSSITVTLSRKARACARDILYGKTPPPLGFDAAVLALPVDFAGNGLDDTPLLVPPRSQVVSVIHRCNSMLPDLNQYCERLLNDIQGDCYLYLPNMFTEAGFTPLDKEVALYEEVIRQNSPVGSTLLIKLHPRTCSPVFDILQPILEPDYTVKIISQGQFKSIPIELWTPLIARCPIVAFSSSSLSLRYLYDKDVIVGLSEDLVDKYFYKEITGDIRDMLCFEREALLALKTWDGQSILWKPKLENNNA